MQPFSQEASPYCTTVGQSWYPCRPSENRGRSQQASCHWSGPGRAVQLLDTSPPCPPHLLVTPCSARSASRPVSSFARCLVSRIFHFVVYPLSRFSVIYGLASRGRQNHLSFKVDYDYNNDTGKGPRSTPLGNQEIQWGRNDNDANEGIIQ